MRFNPRLPARCISDIPIVCEGKRKEPQQAWVCYLLPGLVNVSTGPLYLLDISEQWRRCSYPDLLGNQLKDLTLPDPRETPAVTIHHMEKATPWGVLVPRGEREGYIVHGENGGGGRKRGRGVEWAGGGYPPPSHNTHLPPPSQPPPISRGKEPPLIHIGRGVPGEISACDRANGDAPQESGSSKSIKLIDPDLT
jgi:hypothetical protein